MGSELPIDHSKRHRQHLRLEQAHSAYEIQKVSTLTLICAGSRPSERCHVDHFWPRFCLYGASLDSGIQVSSLTDAGRQTLALKGLLTISGT